MPNGNFEIQASLAIALLVLLVFAFNQQISYILATTKTAFLSVLTGSKPGCKRLVDDDDLYDVERFGDDPKNTQDRPAAATNRDLDALGYTADAPWTEVLKAQELDPSTFQNHMDYVKDVRRFSSGANFTSVTDDNTNLAFTNFQGLRRPEHVAVGKSLRTTYDVDESVLQRNRNIRW